MLASLLHLPVESWNLSQAANKATVVKPERIHKMKIVVFLWICLALQAVISFFAWNQTANNQKLE